MNCKSFALISLMVSRKGGAIKQFISCICERKGTTDTLSCWKMLSGGENRCLNLDDKLFILRPIIVFLSHLPPWSLYSDLALGWYFSACSV